MIIGGVNLIAVLLATLAALLAGAAWYGLFQKAWLKAAGLDLSDIRDQDGASRGSPLRYVVALCAYLVMAFCLAKLLVLLDGVSVGNAMAGALFCWLGFIATTLSVNHRFQMKSWKLTLIDGGYWLVVILVEAIVIGAFG